MATNHVRWVRDLNGAAEPLVMLGLFVAGSSTAIKRGEILRWNGSSWIPIASDAAMTGTVVVANEEIKSGDRAGYYDIIVPRPGDVFEFALAAAAAVAVGALLYYSSSEALTTSGTYPLGSAVGQEHYPQKQGHLADDASGDAGTTVRSTSYVRMVFARTVSYLSKLLTYGAGIDIGDAGGFTGIKFNAGSTYLEFHLDGTLVGHIAASGAYNDDVT